jgi:hypothetical protein
MYLVDLEWLRLSSTDNTFTAVVLAWLDLAPKMALSGL